MRTFFLGLGACALAGLLASSDARATTDMGGGAAVCAPANNLANQIVAYLNGGAFNTNSSRSADVVCGSVRLEPTAPGQFIISYWDATTVGRVSCTASISSWDGGTKLWSETQYSSTTGTSTFGSFLFKAPSMSTLGYASAVCTIPPVQSGQASAVRGIQMF